MKPIQMRFFLFVLALPAVGQPVIAPSPEPVGTARGENASGYNFVNQWETGYRWRDVNGSLGKYRSDVNFGNGLRLLGSNLSVNSLEGQGGYFDELLLNTQGLGGDPYQFANFRVSKNQLYRYDLIWRENQYFNPALTISNGQHLIDTTRQWQDHNFVLFPQSSVRFFLGYARVGQTGPALTTGNFFTGGTGDEFLLFGDVQRRQNEYRLGAEVDAFGLRLSLVRGFEYFKDDTESVLAGVGLGNNLTDRNTLSSLRRTQPWHGSTGSWRVLLLTKDPKRYSVNARFTYAGTRRNFIFDELAVGTDRFGAGRNRQILWTGNGRRPVTTGAVTLSLFANRALTLNNHSAFHSTRIDGDGDALEINNAALDATILNFQYLGILTASNTSDLQYQLSDRVGLTAGYHFSWRRIRSIEQTAGPGFVDRIPAEQDNRLHAGRLGLRLRPAKAFTVVLDGEVGRTDRPFFPTSERNYQAGGARVQYRTRSLTLSALARLNYNTNSFSLANHSLRSRTYSADASWNLSPRFSLDASYSKLHLDTVSALAYFYEGDLLTGDQSVYISNIHSGTLSAHVTLGRRADLTVGYSRIQDTGGVAPGGYFAPDAVRIGFQTYPLRYDSPFGRLSFPIKRYLRLNVGYQYYRYAEDVFLQQDYRAHTGFSSLSWSF